MTTETTTPGGAELFKDFAAGSGSFFRPVDGDMFIGAFTGVSDAGESSYEGKTPTKGIWWHFDLYKFSDPTARVRYLAEDGPDKGKQLDAVLDGRTTSETGPRSKARAWFAALLKREMSNDEDKAKVFAEAVGKRAVLVCGKNEDGTRIVLKTILPYKEMS